MDAMQFQLPLRMCWFVFLVAAEIGALEPSAPLTIKTKRETDQVEIQVQETRVVISIVSPTGISHASIKRTGDQWPESLQLRLHLTGLERFQVSNGKRKLSAAVSQVQGKIQIRNWCDDKEEQTLNDRSPFWLNVRMIGREGKPAAELPLKNGYFEMRLPTEFLAENPESIQIDWIDFYRS
jgi:hypothetical protein